MTGRAQAWLGGVVAGTAFAALAGYLIKVGLDNADKVASVIGLFVALAGLAVSVAGLRRQAGTGGAQAVENSTIGEGITQIADTGGSVKITRRGTHGAAPAAPTGAAPPTTASSDGGQTVRGTSTAGPVDQIRNTSGDVETEQ